MVDWPGDWPSIEAFEAAKYALIQGFALFVVIMYFVGMIDNALHKAREEQR